MWFPLILPLSLFAFTTSSFGFSIQNAKPGCPPKAEIKPCKCSDSGEVTAVCRNVNEEAAIQNAFSKNPNWIIQKFHFDRCVVDYIPSTVVKYSSLKTLNVSSSTLVSLFDEAPSQTPKMDIFLYDVNFLRGIQWELFKNTSVDGIGTFNVKINHFGKDFREYMPKGMTNLWFENSKTTHISHQAFKRMENLKIFTLTGGHLKKLAREWFPQPWKVNFLNFSNQKITALPKDMFEDLPELTLFAMFSNFLTTIDEKVFTKNGVTYSFERNPIYCNCDLKWITTSGRKSGKLFFGTCDGPDTFKGKKLNTLTEKDFNFCQ